MEYVKGVAPVTGDKDLYLQNELSRIEAALRSGGGSSSSSGSTGGSSAGSVSMRLSLTTGVAVTSADVAGAATIYGVPFGDNSIGIYNGSWVVRTFDTDRTLILDTSGHQASKCYSIFAYWDGDQVKLGTGPVWTGSVPNETPGIGAGTAETEVYQGRLVNKYDIVLRNNGVGVNVGARFARLVGGFGTTGVAGQTEDSVKKRLLSNVYNAVPRAMKRVEATDSWTGDATNAWRQANASSLNQLEFFQITASYPVSAYVSALVQNNAGTPRTAATGIGLDTTSAPYLTSFKDNLAVDNTRGWPQKAWFNDYVPIGRHTLTWLELSGTTDIRTWYGDAGSDPNFQTGISGTVIS